MGLWGSICDGEKSQILNVSGMFASCLDVSGRGGKKHS